MRNDNHRRALETLSDRFGNLGVHPAHKPLACKSQAQPRPHSLKIDRTGRFVHDEHFGTLQQSPGEAQKLALAMTEIGSFDRYKRLEIGKRIIGQICL